MPKFVINGPARLSGEIEVSVAKNAALKIVPASILSEDPITINNLPNIEDIGKSFEVLEHLGAKIEHRGKTARISTKEIDQTSLDEKLAKKFRASIMFVGPLLARFGEVRFPHPGGCVIGAGGRPIDIFLEGFKSFGAEIRIEGAHYRLTAPRLKACEYFFPKVSVTATENLMMTAVLAEGSTILKNCAMEPEITALAQYLNAQGARIKGAGTPTMVIEGVKRITAGDFTIIPDRIVAGSFAIMAAATGSELKITKCNPEHFEVLLAIFNKIGVPFEKGNDYVHVKKADRIKSYGIITHEYPGFPTDMQSPFTVLMTQAEGSCIIHETIYDRRLLFVDMLSQMGADIIMCDPHRVVVNGPNKLYGKKLTSPDLRAGIAMIIAGLAAEGRTEIDNIYQIDRGYEEIDAKLRQIGADISREQE